MKPLMHRTLRPMAMVLTLSIASGLDGCAGSSGEPPEAAVRALWADYLQSKQGKFAANAGTPSELWSKTEQRKWPMYDLAGYYLPDGAVPEVMLVSALPDAANGAYEIVTRFRAPNVFARDSTTVQEFTLTVLVHRRLRHWVLANALPHRTATWARETRGRISYRIAPNLTFDAAKADRAAAFVDSLAQAFDVPLPKQIEYYSAESVDQALEILGVGVPQAYGPNGGFAKPINGQVFSGDPTLGEEYRHELAHVVLAPVLRGAETTLLASEGVPTWLGGTGGRDFRGAVRHLDSYLTDERDLSLDQIIYGAAIPSEIRNAAGAVLAEMVNEAGGAAAVREYLRTGWQPAVFHAGLERLLQRPWPSIEEEWRNTVRRIVAIPVGPPYVSDLPRP